MHQPLPRPICAAMCHIGMICRLRRFANDKKLSLLLSSLIIVVVVALIVGLIGGVLEASGGAVASIRNAIDGGGANFLGGLVPIISFLLIMVVLHFLVGMDWEKTTWIALIALFLLYLLFSLLPELAFVGV